jgi:hypothetical protein
MSKNDGLQCVSDRKKLGVGPQLSPLFNVRDCPVFKLHHPKCTTVPYHCSTTNVRERPEVLLQRCVLFSGIKSAPIIWGEPDSH